MYAFVNAAAALRPSAFAGRAVSAAAPPCVATVSMAMSKSVPFWEAPPKLDGRPGDAGFDPLGFSNKFDLDFLSEAEIKHGRIAMLGILGWIFPEQIWHLPSPEYSQANPLDALGSVGFLPLAQILLFIAVCEAGSYSKVYYENCANPGDYGWDPLGLCKDPKKKAFYQLAEVKNGRLAMLAVTGAFHHALLTHLPMGAQFQQGVWFGGYPTPY